MYKNHTSTLLFLAIERRLCACHSYYLLLQPFQLSVFIEIMVFDGIVAVGYESNLIAFDNYFIQRFQRTKCVGIKSQTSLSISTRFLLL